jgi:hypothetical protein
MDLETQRVGLCVTCEKAKVIDSARGSRFYLCTVPELPKYPQLPRRACPAYVKRAPSSTMR